MIRQLSIFAENKKGAMNRITQILAQYGKEAPEHIGEYVKSMKEAIN